MRPSRYATLFILAVLLAFGPRAGAQAVGDCAPGMAEADLNVNDVRARVFNAGTQFFDPDTPTEAYYFAPKTTNHIPIFLDALQIAGVVDGEIRAASSFGTSDFWPGPLGAEGNPPADCAVYDRVWIVSRSDVAHYLNTGEATDDLRDWPADLGAPVLDGDGVAGNYNLEGGDEPAISGEQMAWWVMNDAGNVHDRSSTPPLGVEVQASAFAAPSLVPAVDRTTLYRYRIVNRSADTIDSVHVGLYGLMDLGDAVGNLVGTDTTRGMAYVYHNATPDEQYGPDPPAFGRLYLDTPPGPTGEPLGMTASMFFFNSAPYPQTGNVRAPEIYRYLQGRWADDTPITEGGDGYLEDGPATTFMYAGDPLQQACWSITNLCPDLIEIDSQGRSLSAMGPFRLEPGEAVEVVYALVFAQGQDHEDSLLELRVAADYVADAYGLGVFDPQLVSTAAEPAPRSEAFALRAAPNPFTASASIELTVADGAGRLRLAVYDVLGREVAVLADGTLAPGVHPFRLGGAGLPSGTYVVRLETGRQAESILLTHVE